MDIFEKWAEDVGWGKRQNQSQGKDEDSKDNSEWTVGNPPCSYIFFSASASDFYPVNKRKAGTPAVLTLYPWLFKFTTTALNSVHYSLTISSLHGRLLDLFTIASTSKPTWEKQNSPSLFAFKLASLLWPDISIHTSVHIWLFSLPHSENPFTLINSALTMPLKLILSCLPWCCHLSSSPLI